MLFLHSLYFYEYFFYGISLVQTFWISIIKLKVGCCFSITNSYTNIHPIFGSKILGFNYDY